MRSIWSSQPSSEVSSAPAKAEAGPRETRSRIVAASGFIWEHLQERVGTSALGGRHRGLPACSPSHLREKQGLGKHLRLGVVLPKGEPQYLLKRLFNLQDLSTPHLVEQSILATHHLACAWGRRTVRCAAKAGSLATHHTEEPRVLCTAVGPARQFEEPELPNVQHICLLLRSFPVSTERRMLQSGPVHGGPAQGEEVCVPPQSPPGPPG